MNIVLIGYRGSGKTSIGRLLAGRMGRTFIDLDEVIIAAAGKTIRRIFDEDGEARFRAMETEALRRTLALQGQVIALGGGAVVAEANRAMLATVNAADAAECRVVYLRCEAAELARRIASDAASAENRPDLTTLGGGLAEVVQKLAEREPIYREVMDVQVDVTNLSIDEAAERVARLL